MAINAIGSGSSQVYQAQKAKSYPVDFKGTAFGDPAKIASPANENTSKTSAKVLPPNYKGTAFGDPAKTATQVSSPTSKLQQSAQLVGSKFDKSV